VVLPFYPFVVCRQSLQAMRHTAPILLAIVLANLLNALLNWILIFGHLGLPAMGVVGSAWATTASRWLLVVGLMAVSWVHLRPYLCPVLAASWDLGLLGRI